MTVIFVRSSNGTLKSVFGITRRRALLERARKKFLSGNDIFGLTRFVNLPLGSFARTVASPFGRSSPRWTWLRLTRFSRRPNHFSEPDPKLTTSTPSNSYRKIHRS
jgi:hypothetical protein